MNGAIFHGSSDTEVISYVITRNRLTQPSIEDAISATMNEIEGAYSLVIMSPTKLIAARDPHGFRPLWASWRTAMCLPVRVARWMQWAQSSFATCCPARS